MEPSNANALAASHFQGAFKNAFQGITDTIADLQQRVAQLEEQSK